MREILYRGKDITGNWHYGVPLVFTEDYVCITAPHTYNKKVEANTIGQYIGLCDKNGKKIFEGDIVKEWDATGKLKRKHGLVHWDDTFSCWRTRDCGTLFGGGIISTYIVIGNIHDNPELLKEGAE